jgi:hypothetical protein
VAATPLPDAAALTEEKGEAPLSVANAATGRPPVAAVDAYIDDYILLSQTCAQQIMVLRSALNAIDEVLRPLTTDDPKHRKEPAFIKKMLQGDACRDTQKRIVSWDFDTAATTLYLPPH